MAPKIYCRKYLKTIDNYKINNHMIKITLIVVIVIIRATECRN